MKTEMKRFHYLYIDG